MLIFARHGNTFEREEVPRIVGANEDIPLTSEGREQALALGRALRDSGVEVSRVLAGPLSRTLQFARIAVGAAGCGMEVSTDERLRELDFGSWSGMSDPEVISTFGEEALRAWRKQGRRPEGCGWTPSEQLVRSNLKSLVAGAGGNTLCVTSNGILRYAMELDPVAFASTGRDGGFRVKTGNVCAFRITRTGTTLLFWNQEPTALLFRGF
jgi:broad specificity phosphatase PhoE